MVPYLTTALTGPLLELEKRLLDAQPTIEHWFRQQWKEQAAPFYTSVDIRNQASNWRRSTPICFPAASTISIRSSCRCRSRSDGRSGKNRPDALACC